jgi:hypothetical protein
MKKKKEKILLAKTAARDLGLRKDARPLPKSDAMPTPRALRQIRLAVGHDLVDRSRATRHSRGKAGSSEQPESRPPDLTKTGLKRTARVPPSIGIGQATKPAP